MSERGKKRPRDEDDAYDLDDEQPDQAKQSRLDRLGEVRLTGRNTAGRPYEIFLVADIPDSKRARFVAGIEGRGRYKDADAVRGVFQQFVLKPEQKLDGETHQAEHVLGYKVLARRLPRPNTAGYKGRGEAEQALAREIEGDAPAYHEEKNLHRAHPGTGLGGRGDFYRGAQRAALEGQRQPVTDGGPQDPPPRHRYSNAVQLNQLERNLTGLNH